MCKEMIIMEITINGIEKNLCDFTTDVLSVEKKRIERKMLNMEYVSDEEVTAFLAIDEELKKRSEQ
jgi:hypothetical protein